jgi:nucleoside-diphosphate-sugar epimerase
MKYGNDKDRDNIIPSAALSIIKGLQPHLSSGRVRGDWIYVEDVVDAFVSAIATPAIEGQTFDVGTGRLTSIRALVEKLLKVMGSSIVPLFGAIADRPQEQEIFADTRPAFDRLGWRAATSLEDGLRETAAWYRANLGR